MKLCFTYFIEAMKRRKKRRDGEREEKDEQQNGLKPTKLQFENG